MSTLAHFEMPEAKSFQGLEPHKSASMTAPTMVGIVVVMIGFSLP